MRAALLATAETSGVIFMIFLGADMLNGALALTQMPARAADVRQALPLPPLAVLALVLLFYIVLGGVMDELSMLLLTLPVVFPAVMQLDLFGLPLEAKAHLVRRAAADRGQHRTDRAAGRTERLRGRCAGARRADCTAPTVSVGAFLVADAVRLVLLLLVPPAVAVAGAVRPLGSPPC